MAVRADAGPRAKGRSPVFAANDPAKVRNVVLVGPSGSGKTTLVEALLAHTAAIPRAGTVVDGSTVCDHDPAAIRQQRSVALAVAPLMHQDTKINLIDTPGYGDFVGELRAGLRAADAALFVISAHEVSAQQGGEGAIDPATVAQWEECAAVGMPRAVVVARCDHPRGDLEATVDACQQAFGNGVAPLYLPIRDGAELSGLYGLLSQTPADRAPDGRRGGPRRAHRGHHRTVRGRDAHGALPRRRGHRGQHADRRPGDGGRARPFPPGHPDLREQRHRPRCAAGGAGRRLSLAVGAPVARGRRRGRQHAPAADRRSGRSAGRRGRAHLRGRLRGAGLAGAGVLRDTATGVDGARQRAPRDHPDAA